MDKSISLVTAKVSTEKKNIQDELNPISWRKSNLWGFTMFSKEIKITAVSAYLSGMPQSQIRQKYHIKGSATLYNWVYLIQTLGHEGVKVQ